MADIELEIDDLSVGGDGVARAGGRRVFVPFTIPGERVRARLPPGQRGETARLLEVLRASPHRVTPGCRHFGPDAAPGVGPCGGCSWQHIAYPEQLRLKTDMLDRLVRSAVPQAPRAEPMLAATSIDDPWGYRQKVHFVFGTAARGALAMGHYVRGSRRIIPVDECPVHDPRGNAVAFKLYNRFLRGGIAAADARAPGVLRSVAIRAARSSGELMATLVVADDQDRRLRTATRDVMAVAPEVAFHLNVHPENNAFIFGRDTRRLRGPERLRDVVAGTSFLVAPTAFFQTNVAAAELLVQLVAAAIPAASRVLDLYAGTGLFALPLARAGHRVTAVEENRDAVEAGVASARLNRIDPDHCRFIARRAEAALAGMAAPDAVVLDPPREGCDAAVLDEVFGRLRPKTGVYVSCNPEALAEDLAAIVSRGYRMRSIQPVDMFPHTAHIEAVVVVTR